MTLKGLPAVFHQRFDHAIFFIFYSIIYCSNHFHFLIFNYNYQNNNNSYNSHIDIFTVFLHLQYEMHISITIFVRRKKMFSPKVSKSVCIECSKYTARRLSRFWNKLWSLCCFHSKSVDDFRKQNGNCTISFAVEQLWTKNSFSNQIGEAVLYNTNSSSTGVSTERIIYLVLYVY